jgi:hypothetical protein
LLSSGDVEKKLQLTAPSTGDGVWIELLGTFPRNTFGSPVLNQAGELVGVVLLDSQGSGPKASTSGFGGGSTSAIPATSMRRVYAISSDALAPLLAQAASPANEVLFTMTVAPLQRPSRPAAGQWSVRLASGETIDEKSFAASAAGNLGTLTYPGGGRCATLALSERKTIDGLLTIYTSDGKELLRESMVQGRRQGPLTVWTAAGKCILAAQFERDLRHGYAAYFRDGAPWLIQEHREGTLEVQHLVRQGAVFHTVPSGKTVPTITSVLAQYGEWPQWEAGLKAMESAIERWAKEADRHQRAGRTRLNPDQLNAAQRDAVVAIEEFRKLAL